MEHWNNLYPGPNGYITAVKLPVGKKANERAI